MDETRLSEAMTYYGEQGAPEDQQMLAALLREVQEMEGGALRCETLETIALGYHVPLSLLRALIGRIPSLRLQTAPHRLELCQTCKKNRELLAFVHREYGAQSGCASQKGGFTLHVVPCMKNCAAGPSIRWDGTLHPRADEALLRRLIEKGSS